jgi:hypothetical protein
MPRELSVIAIGALSGIAIAALIASGQLWIVGHNLSVSGRATWLVLAMALGVPIGAASAFVVDCVLLADISWKLLLRRVPVLFLAGLVGSAPAVIGWPPAQSEAARMVSSWCRRFGVSRGMLDGGYCTSRLCSHFATARPRSVSAASGPEKISSKLSRSER